MKTVAIIISSHRVIWEWSLAIADQLFTTSISSIISWPIWQSLVSGNATTVATRDRSKQHKFCKVRLKRNSHQKSILALRVPRKSLLKELTGAVAVVNRERLSNYVYSSYLFTHGCQFDYKRLGNLDSLCIISSCTRGWIEKGNGYKWPPLPQSSCLFK